MSNRISKHIEILVLKGVDSYRGHGMSIRKLRAGDRPATYSKSASLPFSRISISRPLNVRSRVDYIGVDYQTIAVFYEEQTKRFSELLSFNSLDLGRSMRLKAQHCTQRIHHMPFISYRIFLAFGPEGFLPPSGWLDCLGKFQIVSRSHWGEQLLLYKKERGYVRRTSATIPKK